jgi:uncharacterized protein (TIGR00299 family) protein
MAKILYFDIHSGISGDMTIGALLDLEVDQDDFLKELDKLNLSGYKVEISRVQKNGITASDFKVILENEEHPDHLHDHNEHSHNNQDDCTGCGNHNHEHSEHAKKNHDHAEHFHEEDAHKHSHTGHSHQNRNFSDIKELINKSELNTNVKNLSIEIFKHVAEAEAKVHAKSIEEVHFHEVGAVDSIIDIVGTAILIDIISPDNIYSSPVSLGTGLVNTAHGIIPVPAPATIEILRGVPVYSTGIRSELVTPTGAAIIKTLAEEFITMPELEIKKIAYGSGKKNLEAANLLRIYEAETVKKKRKMI